MFFLIFFNKQLGYKKQAWPHLVSLQKEDIPPHSLNVWRVKQLNWIETAYDKFPKFPSFRSCPIPKIENSEILEIFLSLQILTVFATWKSRKVFFYFKFQCTMLEVQFRFARYPIVARIFKNFEYKKSC